MKRSGVSDHGPVQAELRGAAQQVRERLADALAAAGSTLAPAALQQAAAAIERALQLAESIETRYRTLLDTIDIGILLQDGDGAIVSANAAAEQCLGASKAELTSGQLRREDWSLVDADGQVVRYSDLPGPRALRTGKAVESTVIGVYSPRLRGYRWVSITAVPQFREGEQKPFQVISMFGDVTTLMRESELFRQTQALASIGGWQHDFVSELVFWTDEIYRLIGLDLQQPVTFERMLALFIPADSARLRQAVEGIQNRTSAFDLELRLTTLERNRRWVRVIGRAIVHRGIPQGVSGTLQDITLRRVQEEQLLRQALTDPLTGLANRDALLRELARAIDSAPAGEGPALLYIDLDRFKVVNDLLGHAAGDALLVAASQRLKDAAGPHAFVARYGGDEFMVLLVRGSFGNLALELAERVTLAFARPFDYDGEEFTITTSVGVARYPADGESIQQLINHADAAMYDAKRRGRNKWQTFTPQLARELTDRLLVETQLRRALDNNELYLEYQPQVDLASGCIVAAEALVRWRSRLLGELKPNVFITHAENTGDIVRIGAWVIRQSLRQLRAWQDAGIVLPRIAVNVSQRQLLSENLIETVANALAEFDLPGESLELELTERVLIDDADDTLDTFRRLKRLGVILIIDDFGEGYSALNYLRRLPFDGLKISHTFMQGIPANVTDTTICEAVIDIAQSLELSVIAEGVENQAQREFLLRQGVSLAQGYLFAPPLSPAALAQSRHLFGGGVEATIGS